MAHHKALTVSENDHPLNRAALERLKEAKADAPAHHLHLLSLAAWGLENGADGEWPVRVLYVLDDQVSLMFGWKPANAMSWLVTNPNGGDKKEQEHDLLSTLEKASDPKWAAAVFLGIIYSRMQATVTQLQPAASELS